MLTEIENKQLIASILGMTNYNINDKFFINQNNVICMINNFTEPEETDHLKYRKCLNTDCSNTIMSVNKVYCSIECAEKGKELNKTVEYNADNNCSNKDCIRPKHNKDTECYTYKPKHQTEVIVCTCDHIHSYCVKHSKYIT